MAPFDSWQTAVAATEVLAGNLSDARHIRRLVQARWESLLRAGMNAPLQARQLRQALGARWRTNTALPLHEVPPMARREWQTHLEESWTDPAIQRPALEALLADPDRLGDGLLGRYAVWTSSGSSGIPAVFLQDARALAVYDALESIRFAAPDHVHYQTSSRLNAPGASSNDPAPRLALVAATGGHFAGVAMMSRLLRIAPAMARRIRIFSILQPLPTLVQALNAFAPAIIATYPTVAESLAEEQARGRLKLALQAVWLGGEQLGEPLARHLAERFGCDIRESYGASEFLSIAWSCAHGRLHVNSDWVVLEPVDSKMRAVEPGTASHTVLLTNLANHVQPLIRYDLGDSITQASTPCTCGSVFPSIEVEGRQDDVLVFGNLATRIRLLPLALATLLEDEAGCFDFQLIRIESQTLSLRLGPSEAASPFRRTESHRVLMQYLTQVGLPHVRVIDDPTPPRRDERSGKLRRILDGCRASQATRP